MDRTETGDERRQRRREARRARARAGRFDTTIPSPCISVCQIDGVTDCCIGCLRTIDEIRDWPIMTAGEKTAALARIAASKAAGKAAP